MLLYNCHGVEPIWLLRETGNLALEAEPGIPPIQTPPLLSFRPRDPTRADHWAAGRLRPGQACSRLPAQVLPL